MRQNNKIKSIYANTFKELTELEALYLNNNQLIELDYMSFVNLGRLKALCLNDNKLKLVDRKCFESLKSIGVVQFYGNEFKALSYLKLAEVKSTLYHDMDQLNKNRFVSDWSRFLEQFPVSSC